MSDKGLWLGIDLGAVRTGVAISDSTGTIAGGIEVIIERVLGNLAKRISEIVFERGVRGIVIGLPINMDGSEGSSCERVRFFVHLLSKRVSVPIVFRDETLTSVNSHEILISLGKRGKERKTIVDALSAELILQGFLDEK